MKKIPSRLSKDYCLVNIAYMLTILALHPVYFGEYRITESIAVLTFIQTIILCITILLCEVIVTYVMHKPFSYSDTLQERCKHFLLVVILGIPIMTTILLLFNPIIEYGFEHIDYAFKDYDGSFTLKWLFGCLAACSVASIIELMAHVAISEIRHKNQLMKELEAINEALAWEHEALSTSQKTNDNGKEETATTHKAEPITLQGESRESLTVNPTDIVYVESIANYLNVVYYNDSDLCRKRLRSSLKEVEATLEAFPYIVHIHRAFLVNIKFITQVTGNTTGYKLQLFGTDKILPVSKSNIASFRDKVNNQADKLELKS